jgi:hypothetical protein
MRLNEGKQNQLNFREMKQTAVEWQHIELSKFLYGKSEFTDANDILIKTKEMEQEQMLNAFEESRITHPMIGFKHETFKDYYNETFNTNEK